MWVKWWIYGKCKVFREKKCEIVVGMGDFLWVVDKLR